MLNNAGLPFLSVLCFVADIFEIHLLCFGKLQIMLAHHDVLFQSLFDFVIEFHVITEIPASNFRKLVKIDQMVFNVT